MKKLIFCFSLLLITPLFSGHLYAQPVDDDEKQEKAIPKEYDTQKTTSRDALRAQRSALKKKMEAEREAAIKKRVINAPKEEAIEEDKDSLIVDPGDGN